MLEVHHPLAERVEAVLADDRVRRDAHLARPGGRLEDRLAVERRVVQPALAEDDGEGGPGALVVADGVEDEGRPGLEPGPEAAHRPPEMPPAAPDIGTPRGSRGRSRATRSRRLDKRRTAASS